MERDTIVIQKVVNEMAERSQAVFARQQTLDDTTRHLVPLVLQRGIDNTDLSMLSSEQQCAILSAVGDELLRRGRLKDALDAFVLSMNRDRIVQIGEQYELLGQLSEAVNCYRLAADEERLLALGKRCLERKRFEEAMKAFRLVEDEASLERVGDECLTRGKYELAAEITRRRRTRRN